MHRESFLRDLKKLKKHPIYDRIDELAFATLPAAQDFAGDSRDLDCKGGLCPEGHGILSRVRLDLEPSFFLERCSRCGGVWFDRGEWQRLASLRLQQTLPEFWTDAWQASQHSEERRVAYRRWASSAFGPELFERLLAVARELRGHEHRPDALAFLRNESTKAE